MGITINGVEVSGNNNVVIQGGDFFKPKTMKEILEKYCKLDKDKMFYSCLINTDLKFNHRDIKHIYCFVEDSRNEYPVHEFTSPDKLEMFFKSLL